MEHDPSRMARFVQGTAGGLPHSNSYIPNRRSSRAELHIHSLIGIRYQNQIPALIGCRQTRSARENAMCVAQSYFKLASDVWVETVRKAARLANGDGPSLLFSAC